MNPKLEQQLAELRPGSHLCLLYSDPAEQLDTALPFIRDGLRIGQRCMYIADDRTVGEITEGLAARGVDACAEIDRGSLTLQTKRETYLRSGLFDPGLMIGTLQEACDEAVAGGYPAFRVTGEMTWALGNDVGTERLIEYEARLNDFLPAQPALAICQYNLARFPPELIEQVLRTHPIAIIGRELYSNLYYEPPSQVLGQSTAAERTGWMIGQLARARQLEKERERLEEQLRHSQKLEAVGQLAGGIAHDFNNILSVILSLAGIVKDELGSDHPVSGDIEEIQHAATRAADLTRQLLAFSRRQVLRPRRVKLDALVAGMERMLRRLLPESVDLSVTALEDPWVVQIDPSHFEQVLVNLTINARDAMPNGGRITVESANVVLDEEYAQTHADATAGPHVMLAVSDTGEGMAPEVRDRAFEPFFSTKSRGKGTGLGLSTCYGIVRQAGGNIWVYSEPGRGTTFKIYLPAVGGSAEVAPSVTVEREVESPTETVLVVEDDSAVRAVATRILRRAGYTVLEAPDPEEAIRIAERHGGPIGLLLTDVVMPGMGGKELADRIQQARPDIAVLFMSGYTDNSVVHHGVLEPDVELLQKPLVPATLRMRVRGLLDQARRDRGER